MLLLVGPVTLAPRRAAQHQKIAKNNHGSPMGSASCSVRASNRMTRHRQESDKRSAPYQCLEVLHLNDHKQLILPFPKWKGAADSKRGVPNGEETRDPREEGCSLRRRDGRGASA